MAQAAAVVRAGGSSSLGRRRTALEWHGSPLLRRVVGIVGRSVDGRAVLLLAAVSAGPSGGIKVEDMRLLHPRFVRGVDDAP